MSLAPGIECDAEMLETLRLALSKISPAELDVYAGSSPTRNLLLRVTDPRLLEQTGGIVQGMSGSPILQNGKLVGAVTHVLVSDPSRGYGIFIENMLDAAGLGMEQEAGALGDASASLFFCESGLTFCGGLYYN